MRTLLITLIFLLPFFSFAQVQGDSIRVVVDENKVFWHKIKIIEQDTVNGREVAVYVKDTTTTAYIKHFYNGYQNGVYKSFYPNGKIMEKIIYQKDKKNGEYVLFSYSGMIMIKGVYKDDVKNGFWADRVNMIYGRYKNGKRHKRWKWYYNETNYYRYYFNDGVMVPTKNPVPDAFKEE